jgi:hypothetical protein
VCKYDACAERCLCALNVIHLDFLALKITLNSVANLSHTASIVRIARTVGASRTTSSAYASAATNQLPIKHPTPAFFSSMSNVSRYTQNNIGLIMAPCFTPLETEKVREETPFHKTRTCCPVYILSNRRITRGGTGLSKSMQALAKYYIFDKLPRHCNSNNRQNCFMA